jgi:hypothetical protein
MSNLAGSRVSTEPFARRGQLGKTVPVGLSETIALQRFGLLENLMIFFVSPTVHELTSHRCVVGIPLDRHTRNFIGSMYLSALCTGADLTAGLIALKLIQDEAGGTCNVDLAFKGFSAEFLKYPEGEVHFTCDDGGAIQDLVRQAVASGDRRTSLVRVIATVPSSCGDEPVARFALSLSVEGMTASAGG